MSDRTNMGEEYPIRRHVLLDGMDDMPAVNELRCSCGVEIHPDCDVSVLSINAAFEDHLCSVRWMP